MYKDEPQCEQVKCVESSVGSELERIKEQVSELEERINGLISDLLPILKKANSCDELKDLCRDSSVLTSPLYNELEIITYRLEKINLRIKDTTGLINL